MAKRYASISPNQNTGIETPRLARIMVPTSMIELCLIAEIIPNVTPTIVANSMAQMVNSIVMGKRRSTIPTTGWLVRNEVPISPRARLPK
jgi:biotin synthase-like enzyme